MKDLSLKESVKIQVKGISGKRGGADSKKSGGGAGGFSGLKPPPAAGSIVHVKSTAGDTSAIVTSTTSSGGEKDVDVDWGDLTSSESYKSKTTSQDFAMNEEWGDFS